MGPAPATESYLVMDAVLEAIDATGAQAVSSIFHFTLHWEISDLGELVGSNKESTAHVLLFESNF